MRKISASHLLAVFCIFVFGTAAAIPTIPDIPSLPTISSNGNTYHVDKDNGNNINNGSLLNPWATLAYAINRLAAGDTLIIHPSPTGYEEWFDIGISGTENNWITIEGIDGINGERVIVNTRMTFGSNVSYIHFKNIDFHGGGGMKLNLKPNVHHVVFDRIEIDCGNSTDNYFAAWIDYGVNNVWFKQMDIHNCGYVKTMPTDCSGVCMKVPAPSGGALATDIIFKNVTVRNNKGDGIGGLYVDSVYFDGSIADANSGDGFDIGARTRAIFKNTVSSNNGNDQGVGFKVWAKESWFVNSIAFNNNYNGIHNKPLYEQSSIYILNCTFVGNNKYKYGGEIRLENLFNANDPDMSSAQVYLYNNLFHTVNTPAVVFEDMTNQKLVEEDNNYYFSAQEANMPRAYNHAMELRESGIVNGVPTRHIFIRGYTFREMADGAWYKATGHGLHNIGTTIDISGMPNPGFVEPAVGNFHLKTASKAIDAGTFVGITADHDGTPVPQGPVPDIGAFEFDNCPTVANLDQRDTNGNGIGDACDPADLAVSLTATPNPAVRGSNITYSATVTNKGPSTASAVIVSGLTGCTLSSNNIPNGSTASCFVSIPATTVGSLTQTVTVSGAEYDPYTANNTASVSATVLGSCSVSRGSKISGKAVRFDKTSISGVTITMTRSDNACGNRTLTASDGTYSFTQLPNKIYSLVPNKTGCTSFNPTGRSVSVSGSNKGSQNFTGTCP